MTVCGLALPAATSYAVDIIGVLGGIGSFIEFYMVGYVYQDADDIHSWKVVTDYYKKDYFNVWFKTTTGYFSTYTPI